jgi:hypothetical protein
MFRQFSVRSYQTETQTYFLPSCHVLYIKFVEYTSKVLYRRDIFSCLFQITFREHHSPTNKYNLHTNLKRIPPVVH